jgi:hypothetical protein
MNWPVAKQTIELGATQIQVRRTLLWEGSTYMV